MFKLFIPWFWPGEPEQPEAENLWWAEWNQEWIHFENSLNEPFESPHDKLLRLAPPFGDLKKLVL